MLATIVAFLGVETGRRLRNAREAGLVASCYERMVAGKLQEVDDREDKRRRLAAKLFGRNPPLPFSPAGVNAAVREIQEEDGNSDALRAVDMAVEDVAFGGGGGGGGGGEGEGGGGDDSDNDSDDSALDSDSDWETTDSDEDNDDDCPGLFLPAPRRGATNAQFQLASPGEGQLRRTTDAMRQLALTLRPSTA